MEEEVKETASANKKTNSEFVEVAPMSPESTVRVNTESTTESYFDGSLLELMAYNYLCTFITAITAGVCRPWGLCMLNKYIYSHTVISGKRLKFDAEGDSLFAKYFKWNFFRLITFGIYSIWIPTRYKEWEVSHLYFEDEKLIEGDSYFTGTVGGYFAINLLTWFITIISFGILSPVAHVIKLRWELEHFVINRKIVTFKGSAGTFFLKKICWLLLSAITFGIYALWINIKTLRWEASNTFLVRKSDGDTRANVDSTTPVSREKKELPKPVLFTIIGIVGIVVVILLVKLISVMGPADTGIKEEIIQTTKLTREELKTMTDHPRANKDVLAGNLKKLNITAIDDFLNSGGKGWYDRYTYEEDGNVVDLQVVLRKKSTICRVYITTSPYSSGPSPECMSVKEFIGNMFGVNSLKDTTNVSNKVEMPVEYREY